MSEIKNENVGIHSLELIFRDRISKKKALLTIKIDIQDVGGYIACDKSQLYLEPDTSLASTLPINVLKLQVNGTAEAYTLPNLVLKSLSPSIDP